MNNPTLDINSLVIIDSPLAITSKLEQVSAYIEERCATASSLVATDETVKEVKKARAELNAEFKVFEDWRKAFKKQVLEPYELVEQSYKQYVDSAYKQADTILKDKIGAVENAVIEQKTREVQNFYEESAIAKLIRLKDFPFSESGIKINVSKTITALKKECMAYLEQIDGVLTAIKGNLHEQEIIQEYITCRNLKQAVETVEARHKMIEQRKIEQEQQAELSKSIEEHDNRINEILQSTFEIAEEINDNPFEEDSENVIDNSINFDENQPVFFDMTFKVTGTIEQLKSLKQFMTENDIKFE